MFFLWKGMPFMFCGGGTMALRSPAERIFVGSIPTLRFKIIVISFCRNDRSVLNHGGTGHFRKMVVYSKKIVMNTEKKIDFVRITPLVKQAVKESGVQDGLVLINPMHITSSIFINDNEKGLLFDFEAWLLKLAPKDFPYEHNKTGEDNGYAHLWRTIMGREVVVSVQNFELELGKWEEIFYGEFDGIRDKKVLIKVLGE